MQFWLLTVLAAVAQAGLFSKSNVLELNAANFRKKVLNNDNVTVVEFYAPWCGHCKSGAGDLKKSAKSLNGLAQVGAVNCDLPENRDLCAHYKINAFPTIKVFQPSKKTDKDFVAINQGEKIKRKAHRVHNYKGPRDSRSINKYAVSKIRNYAATLEGEMSFVWLKANKVPRVVMLPGSRYKSKSIAPLFKVLSNEFFGKMRFGYVPRRADGGWNLIGLQAPEESVIVYLSDDKMPHVYKGELTKTKVTAFLQEQYELEMKRRAKDDISTEADPAEAAFGLEYVVEDQQTEVMQHIVKSEEEFEENWNLYNYYLNSARERKYRSIASEEGVEYTPVESTSVTPTMSTKFTPAEPTEEPDLESFKQFKFTGSAAASETQSSSEPEVAAEEAEIDDPESGNIFEVEDWTDAMLDELDIELAPEEVVAEGADAVAAWKAEMEVKIEEVKKERDEMIKRQQEVNAIRMNQHEKKRAAKNKDSEGSGAAKAATPAQQLPPGITPKPQKQEKEVTEDKLDESHYLRSNALTSIDDLLDNCMRTDKVCVLVSSSYGFVKEDIRVILRARSRFDGHTSSRLLFQFYVDEDNEELLQASEDLGLSPYDGVRTLPDGTQKHNPALAVFDFKQQKYANYRSEGNGFTSEDVVQFVANFMLKKRSVKTQRYPNKYTYWVTQDDVEVLERVGHQNDRSSNYKSLEAEAAAAAAAAGAGTAAHDEL